MEIFDKIKNYFLINYYPRQALYMLLFYPLILTFIGEYDFNGFAATTLMFFAFFMFSIVWVPRIFYSLTKFGVSENIKKMVFPAFVFISILAFNSKEDIRSC